MNNWISVKEKKPKMNMPVLCIVKADCECCHYVPTILAREIITDDGEWEWVSGQIDENSKSQRCKKDKIVYWRAIPKFPSYLPEGFIR
jgi:hypothetical protein